MYNSDFIFSFACAATTWAMFARVGLHAPPPAVLNGGDRWRLMVLATGYHCVVMLWRVGRSDTSEQAAPATLIAECCWIVSLRL